MNILKNVKILISIISYIVCQWLVVIFIRFHHIFFILFILTLCIWFSFYLYARIQNNILYENINKIKNNKSILNQIFLWGQNSSINSFINLKRFFQLNNFDDNIQQLIKATVIKWRLFILFSILQFGTWVFLINFYFCKK